MVAFFVESGFSVPGRVDAAQDYTPLAPVWVNVSYKIWLAWGGLSFFSVYSIASVVFYPKVPLPFDCTFKVRNPTEVLLSAVPRGSE